MSKVSCAAAESSAAAIRDNRMLAKRTFYCIANGAGELTAVDARFFHPPVRTKASVR